MLLGMQAACLFSGSLIETRISRQRWWRWSSFFNYYLFIFTNDPLPGSQAGRKLLNTVKLTVKLTRAGNPAAGEMLSGASAKERVLDYSVEARGLRCINLQASVGGQSYLLCI